MNKSPEIIEVDRQDEYIKFTLRIPPNLAYFPGHFPKHPVLPGVVQLQWVEDLAREYGLISKSFIRVDKLKFQRIISKGYIVNLELKRSADEVVTFQFISEHGQHSSGKLTFG